MIGSLIERFRALPRAARWLSWFVVLVVGYFVVVEPVIDLTNRANERADRYQAQLDAYEARLTSARAEVNDLAVGLRQFGQVAMPGAAQKRPNEFNAQISEILRRNNVSGGTTRSSVGVLKPGPISQHYSAASRVGTRVKDIEFDATPEQIVGVLADLEQSPLVAVITGIDLQQADERRTRTLHARITAEAWIEPAQGVSP